MAEVVRIPVPVFAGRISLKALRQLPVGTHVISNVLHDGRPAIMATIGEHSREEIFGWIKSERLQGRLFYGFEAREDYIRWERRRQTKMESG